jgi:hypothetical protein
MRGAHGAGGGSLGWKEREQGRIRRTIEKRIAPLREISMIRRKMQIAENIKQGVGAKIRAPFRVQGGSKKNFETPEIWGAGLCRNGNT